MPASISRRNNRDEAAAQNAHKGRGQASGRRLEWGRGEMEVEMEVRCVTAEGRSDRQQPAEGQPLTAMVLLEVDRFFFLSLAPQSTLSAAGRSFR